MSQTMRPFLLLTLLAASFAVGACECDPKPPGGVIDGGPDPVVTCAELSDGDTCPDNAAGVCCGGTCATGTCEFSFQECLAPMCTDGTVSCECTTVPALIPGRLADELDSTVQMDGTYVLAGYLPGDPRGGGQTVRPIAYGDLVIGTYDGTSVTWEIVDGIPSGAEPEADPDGFRGGIKAAGPNVGRYPSIEAIGNDLAVVYGDDDTGSLKLATRVDGTWTTSVIHENAGVNISWTSMALDANGQPVVSYLVVNKGDPAAASAQPFSSLRIAKPVAGGTFTGAWEHYELLNAEMRCGAELCGTGMNCVVSGGGTCATPTTDCGEACANGSVCVDGACVQKKVAEDYLIAAGTFTDIELTATGMALVYYDRNTGDLYGQECTGACATPADWAAPFLIDGWSGTRAPKGDSGIGASLSIDGAGVWHVSYVDGTNEQLRYATVNGGAIAYELVDDGTPAMVAPAIERAEATKSYVGDDSSITAVQTADGVEIRIAYADVTRLTTVLAVRNPLDGTWTYSELPTEGSSSFSITAAPAVAPLSYVGSMWYQTTVDPVMTPFKSDTAVFPLGMVAVP